MGVAVRGSNTISREFVGGALWNTSGKIALGAKVVTRSLGEELLAASLGVVVESPLLGVLVEGLSLAIVIVGVIVGGSNTISLEFVGLAL